MIGPGSYQARDEESKQMTIGVKRELPSGDRNPGVGQYSPEKATRLVKPGKIEHDFIRQIPRITEIS